MGEKFVQFLTKKKKTWYVDFGALWTLLFNFNF